MNLSRCLAPASPRGWGLRPPGRLAWRWSGTAPNASSASCSATTPPRPASTSSSCLAGRGRCVLHQPRDRVCRDPWTPAPRDRRPAEGLGCPRSALALLRAYKAADLAALHGRVPISSVVLDLRRRRDSHPRAGCRRLAGPASSCALPPFWRVWLRPGAASPAVIDRRRIRCQVFMEKRVLIAVFLSFLVLYAYQAIVPQPKRPARQTGACRGDRAAAGRRRGPPRRRRPSLSGSRRR